MSHAGDWLKTCHQAIAIDGRAAHAGQMLLHGGNLCINIATRLNRCTMPLAADLRAILD